jgi:hypothetical protein
VRRARVGLTLRVVEVVHLYRLAQPALVASLGDMTAHCAVTELADAVRLARRTGDPDAWKLKTPAADKIQHRLAYGVQALALLAELAPAEPHTVLDHWDDRVCTFCGAVLDTSGDGSGGPTEPHEDGCLYVKARTLLDSYASTGATVQGGGE